MGYRVSGKLRLWLLFLAISLLIVTFLSTDTKNLPGTKLIRTTFGSQSSSDNTAVSKLPMVEPGYIYNQLSILATHFQHRESGYDHNLPANVNGHDEFATYWAQEMQQNLQGFASQPQHDAFSIPGWSQRPTIADAFNVEVTVPGATHPAQVVVIGCHYDGMASSSQSANDDASGCAIELGIAKALGNYWQTHHMRPQRTLRFVIFDAEEQGIYGSYHYVNATVNGDLKNIVAMFNEEQSGIAYPLRSLGQLKNALMPLYVELAPIIGPQHTQIQRFHQLMNQAVPAVFQQIRAAGVQAITYHDANRLNVAQPVFTPDQLSAIKLEDDRLGSSDQVPFTQAGIPCATFAGDTKYYQKNAPPISYPYDQPEDTLSLMNTYASGGPDKSSALTLALALPAMLTTWMLRQPEILGETPVRPMDILATIGDIGGTTPGQKLALRTQTQLSETATPSASWNFGDGTTALGNNVRHTYKAEGTYRLTLTMRTAHGQQEIPKSVQVSTHNATYTNVYAGTPSDGRPTSNPNVTQPIPNPSLTDKVLLSPHALWNASLTSTGP